MAPWEPPVKKAIKQGRNKSLKAFFYNWYYAIAGLR